LGPDGGGQPQNAAETGPAVQRELECALKRIADH
jgi:hypothetical protein